ncbi:hypothetical protein [Mucilaginibacter auburnensis]|uniref:AsmA-like protein n=1 Tax=Mucilaginibacter auburnensis TaxID=1457233 RepID=A0A2H9VSL6_9SPHI|nr:hypothetical protein [Mucilaginibacter auburnensis]PJJ83821.1 hypothetical protein CLV57_0816 [Mucilaginibacter auburnensis]
MAIKFLRTKRSRIIAAAITIPVVLLLIAALVINRYWSPILAGKLRDAVIKGSDSLYRADFSDAQLHILQGKIMLYNVSLTPDTDVYRRRIKRGTAPNNLVKFNARRIIVSEIHPFKLYFSKVIDVGRIAINSPHIQVSYQLNHTKDTTDKDHRTAWQKLSKNFKSAHVGNIFLDNISFKYDDYSGNKVEVSEIKQMSLHANDLLIDSTTQTDRSRLLYCKNIIADIKNYAGRSADGLYRYSFKRLKLSTAISQLHVTGFKLDPVDVDAFFAKSNKDRMTVELDSIQLNNFDFLSYQKYRSLTASSLMIKGGMFDVFNAPNKLPTKKDKLENFPHVALRKLKTDLIIDTVQIKHLDVTYNEIGKKSKKTGTLSFNNTNATFLNLTTNPNALKKDSIATAEVNSMFMGQGKLNISFRFNLQARNAPYSYKGHLGAMPLEAMNKATMAFAMVKITDGTLKSYDFNVYGDATRAHGNIALLYNDVKVRLLRVGDSQMYSRKLIPTLFANLFILKHNNPDKPGEAPRVFKVAFKRPKDFSFFKTQWRVMLSGLKPTIGLDAKTEQAVTKRMADMKQKKDDRAKKKKDQALKKKHKYPYGA